MNISSKIKDFKFVSFVLVCWSVLVIISPSYNIFSSIIAEKETFEDEIIVNEDMDEGNQVANDDDDDGVDNKKARGDIKIIDDLDSDADEISEDPDGSGGGIPFTCEGGKCSCLGAADCFSMGRADVCGGGINCQEGNSCSCVMK